MTKWPIALMLVSVAVGAGAIFWPERASIAARVPIDLRVGAVTTAEFGAEWDAQYDIGIEMDGTAAARLFPCTADSRKLGHDCVGPMFPASLHIALRSDGADISNRVSKSTSIAGGSFSRDGTRETYVWPAAYVPLSPGNQYLITVQSLADGSLAAQAKPLLRIAVASSEGKGGWVYRGLIVLGSLASLFVGIVWALASLVRRRRSQ